MSNPAIGHRQVVGSWLDMEIERKNLFFKNNYMSKNKFPLKTIILVDFLKKKSKKIFFRNFFPKIDQNDSFEWKFIF